MSRKYRTEVDFLALYADPVVCRDGDGTKEYAVAKACNILFTKELARRLDRTEVSCFSLYPGVVATDIWRATPFFMKPFVKFIPILTPKDGAKITLFCIESAESSQSGEIHHAALPSAKRHDRTGHQNIERTMRISTPVRDAKAC